MFVLDWLLQMLVDQPIEKLAHQKTC